MSNPRSLTNNLNAPRDDDASPIQQPPQYSEHNSIELRDNTSESASRSVPETNMSTSSRQTTETTATTQSEASAHAGSYRPSNAQAHMPSSPNIYHDFDSSQADEHATPIPDLPPPAYTELPGQISSENNDLGTNAIVADDGRVNIRIDQKSRSLTQLLVPQLQRQITQDQQEPVPPPPYIPEFLGGAPGQDPPPPLNLVIQVVGSRGDVQPFVALGKVLKETYNHRVRLATHPTFKDFVIENGLEFFSIGGDPAELMAFMVKNPGLMPGFDTMRSGDIGKRRKGIAEILRGTWRSCIETGNGLGVDPLHQTVEEWMGIEEQLPEQLKKPFVADAIIANPPAFGHIHCAEKLGIPLHMMFTMPWSPTQQFPHPLANIQSSNADASITNYISYLMVDLLTWQGLGDVINKFRKESLHLDPISIIWGPAMLARLRVPFTYCWSPALIPKPKDWGHHISIAGFYFLNLAQNYTPEPALAAFLDAGEPPVYIGFGSIVVDDPNAMTAMIFEAIKKTGKRALVSKGWGGLGADEVGVPEGVFMLGNCPHDWLFKRVSAVVHHGGAGTTAAGIAAGRPTVVVPFFGDQPFWGAMVARAGAGPDPIPYKELTSEKLAGAITEALLPESLNRAQELCDKIKQEEGSQVGAQAFHQMLKYDDLRCAVTPNLPAVWRVRRTQIRLSTRAATILAQEGELEFSDLKLYRSREYRIDGGPIDPISGGATALMGTATSIMMGVADMPIQTLKLLNIHPDTSCSRKGKERATNADSSSTGESSHTGRPETARTLTSMTNASLVSDDSTPAALPSPGVSVQPPQTSSSLAETTSPDTPGSPSHRSTFLSQAMAASSGHSRSSSRDAARKLAPGAFDTTDRLGHHKQTDSTPSTETRSNSGFAATLKTAFDAGNSEAALDTGKGLARIVGAGFKSPMDFSLNIAQGFNNVPKLYGAEVRPVDKVTDFQSGIKAAAKGFGFGLYDGITGLVTDPYKGAKKEGGLGFVKGIGRGIFSVPFRVMGGAWGVPGYAMKGLYQEMIKSKGKTLTNYIVAARIAQGYDEALSVSDTERAAIINRWKYVKVGVKKKKNTAEEQHNWLHSRVNEKMNRKNNRWQKNNSQLEHLEAYPTHSPATVEHGSSQSSTTIPAWRQAELGLQPGSTRSSFSTPQHADTSHLIRDPRSEQYQLHLEDQLVAEEEAERRELEAAIAASVADSSRGNPEEDQLMAQAIRASITELENVPADGGPTDEEEALKRAIQSSIEEAKRSGYTEEEQHLLEETLRKSILDTSRRRQHSSDTEWESSDTEDDVEFQRILAESKELAHLHQNFPPEYQAAVAAQQSGTFGTQHQSDARAQQSGTLGITHEYSEPSEDEDAELKKVLEESERAEKDRMENLQKQLTEEDIVMEYIKKQSLLEEEHRQRLLQGRNTAGESSGTGARQ